MSLNGNIFQHMPPVTKNLILVNVLIFALMVLIPAPKAAMIDHYCALHSFESPLFNPAQLITYMFLHGGWAHIFFNMFALFMFGTQIEYTLGSKRFLFYYLSCGIGAALIQQGVYALMIHHYAAGISPLEYHAYVIERGSQIVAQGMNYTDPTLGRLNMLVNGPTVGASGAIYGVLLAFGMLYPNQVLMLMIPPMPIKAKWLVLGYGVLELLLGIGGRNDGVAHFCHLGGMIAGILILLYWKKKGLFNGRY